MAFLSLTYVNIATYDVSEVKVYKIKWLEKIGDAKEGEFIISCLIRLKDSFSPRPHLKTIFFLIINWRGKKIHEKSGTNILTKFIWPKKYCMEFFIMRETDFTIFSYPIRIYVNTMFRYIKSKKLTFTLRRERFLWI